MRVGRFLWGLFFIILGIFFIFSYFFKVHNWFLGSILFLIGFAIIFNFSEDKIEKINWVKGGVKK